VRIAELSGRAAVVLGSGLSDLAASLTGARPIPYPQLEGMPSTGVPGHEGALYPGEVEGTPTLVFAGRAHLYEGHDAKAVCFAVREAVAAAGCEVVILTNAAGGIGASLELGAPCLISDHINLTGQNPLAGVPDFLDLTGLYDEGLRELAREIDPGLQEGVYAGVTGPSYETPAEIRMLATLGADLVGMSTVLEAIAARRAGARVMGISVVTNKAAGLAEGPLSHEEVGRTGRRAAARLERLLRGILTRL
jgi:purine-nucleoside phosphorylase